MNDLALGTGVLAVLLALCLLFAALSVRTLRDAEQPLRSAEALLAQDACRDALPQALDAQARWSQAQKYFSCILGHEELDGVAYGFERLCRYTACGETAEARVAAAELRAMLEHLRRMDLPYYYNIL